VLFRSPSGPRGRSPQVAEGDSEAHGWRSPPEGHAGEARMWSESTRDPLDIYVIDTALVPIRGAQFDNIQLRVRDLCIQVQHSEGHQGTDSTLVSGVWSGIIGHRHPCSGRDRYDP
jgi:hypothetical protein